MNNRLRKWENQLRQVLDSVDDLLESKYGDDYALRANRPARGKTAHNAYDGLFEIVAKFSLGIGTSHGPGYVVDIRLSTLEAVPTDVREQIALDAAAALAEELPRAFPGRDLSVVREGDMFRIFGDLSL